MRFLLLLLFIIILFWALSRFVRKSPAIGRRYTGIAAFVLVLLLLALTGRLYWFVALLGVVLAVLLRLLPVLLRLAPQLRKLWFILRHPGEADTARQRSAAGGAAMTAAEAYEVLGLKSGAAREEIIAAHKRLMQKVHPDRGGSDYLAARINLAKTTLLKR
jgi:hypothetical protein